MMNEEEKEAILELKHFSNITAYWKQEEYTNSQTNSYIKIVLNLIKKQQKEIEELEAKNKQYQGIEDGTTIIYKSKAKYVREDRIEKYYVNKNKIREKIKELKEKGNYRDIYNPTGRVHFMKEETDYQIQVLYELLGE